MLTSLEVRNNRNETLTLSLDDYANGYLVHSVEGLGPVKASINSSSIAQMDGGVFQNARRDERNIVMNVALVTDYMTNSVASLRRNLYRYFQTKTQVRLTVNSDDMPSMYIDAVVESVEPTIFSEDPALQISLYSVQPDFLGLTDVVATGTTSTTSASGGLNVLYDGDVDTGALLTVTANRSITGFVIHQIESTGNVNRMTVQLAMSSGQAFVLSSVPGDKYVTLNGLSALYSIDPEGSWIKMTPGTNIFRVVVAGASIPVKVTYRNRYGGL